MPPFAHGLAFVLVARRNSLPFWERIPKFLLDGEIDEEHMKLLGKVGRGNVAAYKVGVLTYHQAKKLNRALARDGGVDKALHILDKMVANIVNAKLLKPLANTLALVVC